MRLAGRPKGWGMLQTVDTVTQWTIAHVGGCVCGSLHVFEIIRIRCGLHDSATTTTKPNIYLC